ERQIGAQDGVAAIVAAERAPERSAEFVLRALREDAQGAAHRVAAEQRALRATQNLGAIEIDELFGQEAVGADLPNAVHERADVTDAAHAEARRRSARAAGTTHDAHVRNRGVQILHVLDTAGLESLARDGHDRDRHLL